MDLPMGCGTSAFTSLSVDVHFDYSTILYWYYIQAQKPTYNGLFPPFRLSPSTFLIAVLGLPILIIISNSATTLVHSIRWGRINGILSPESVYSGPMASGEVFRFFQRVSDFTISKERLAPRTNATPLAFIDPACDFSASFRRT
jgi:hypothetical protein